jgi:hypothetical protein
VTTFESARREIVRRIMNGSRGAVTAETWYITNEFEETDAGK